MTFNFNETLIKYLYISNYEKQLKLTYKNRLRIVTL